MYILSFLTALTFQAIYEIIMDGKSVEKTKNENPSAYNNVKVWAAQGKYFPVALARIKNFKYMNIEY